MLQLEDRRLLVTPNRTLPFGCPTGGGHAPTPLFTGLAERYTGFRIGSHGFFRRSDSVEALALSEVYVYAGGTGVRRWSSMDGRNLCHDEFDGSSRTPHPARCDIQMLKHPMLVLEHPMALRHPILLFSVLEYCHYQTCSRFALHQATICSTDRKRAESSCRNTEQFQPFGSWWSHYSRTVSIPAAGFRDPRTLSVNIKVQD